MTPIVTRQTSLRAVAAATLVLLLSAPTVVAGDPDPVQTLAIAPEGASLRVSDAGSDHDSTIAVAWQLDRDSGPRSFVRWSRDGGETFAPQEKLNAGGGGAYGPQVAVCDDSIWAVSTSPSDSQVVIDAWAFPSAGPPEGGQVTIGTGVGGDVGCLGFWIAVAWFDTSTSPSHLRLRVYLRPDPDDFAFHFIREFDLGPARASHGASVAVSAHGPDPSRWIHVAWMRGNDLRTKRIEAGIRGEGEIFFDKRPTMTLLHDPSVREPLLAAVDPRVALVYGRAGDVVLAVSENHGRTFGAHTTIRAAPCTDCEAGYLAVNVDADGPEVLIETFGGTFPCCGPGDNTVKGLGLLTVPGDALAGGPSHKYSSQAGALFMHPDAEFGAAAEFWSNDWNPTATHQRLRYRAWFLPCLC